MSWYKSVISLGIGLYAIYTPSGLRPSVCKSCRDFYLVIYICEGDTTIAFFVVPDIAKPLWGFTSLTSASLTRGLPTAKYRCTHLPLYKSEVHYSTGGSKEAEANTLKCFHRQNVTPPPPSSSSSSALSGIHQKLPYIVATVIFTPIAFTHVCINRTCSNLHEWPQILVTTQHLDLQRPLF